MNINKLVQQSKEALEFDVVVKRLAELAVTPDGKRELEALTPYFDQGVCKAKLAETTDAKFLLENFGTPPLATMKGIKETLTICEMGTMLTEEQLEEVASFLGSVKRMRTYLKRAEQSNVGIAYYGRSFEDAEEVREAIHLAISGHRVCDSASTQLKNIRKKLEQLQNKVKEKLEQILRSKKAMFADSYISVRNGRFVLPVKKEYKFQVPGSVIDSSGSGNTLFIEPSSITKLQEEISLLEISEQNEVYRILYELTALVEEYHGAITRNMETMVALDIVFAKGKLSVDMGANPVDVYAKGEIVLKEARHPLLQTKELIPLNFSMNQVRGIVITGPNTGGKTVALKTVGLLSMMAQSGLHIPADKDSKISMHDAILCDIGDGQSLYQNLSTFSSHITKVIDIVNVMSERSLILLDELGSGTDPQEGMGIAVAILEELRTRACHFIVTTHYPEVKEYATKAEGMCNARMAFDRETLSPLYRLEIGEAGESCAIYIAQRLGFPEHMLEVAKQTAYNDNRTLERKENLVFPEINRNEKNRKKSNLPKLISEEEKQRKKEAVSQYQIGDSVKISPSMEIGIVYAKEDEHGEVGVQVKGVKKRISHKRIQLHVPASKLYPENYDFSIIFDTVEQRKLNHQMNRKYVEGVTLHWDNEK